jgi:hypothetical protein
LHIKGWFHMVATCYYAGNSYTEGTLTCQDGEQMRCTNNGVWSPTGKQCHCGSQSTESSTHQSSEQVRAGTCTYGSQSYSEGSIMCQGGQRMVLLLHLPASASIVNSNPLNPSHPLCLRLAYVATERSRLSPPSVDRAAGLRAGDDSPVG